MVKFKTSLKTSLKALIFHHSDLDGIGVKIVGTVAAKRLGYTEIETFKCDYGNVDRIVLDRLKGTLGKLLEIDLIIIADISVSPKVAEFINSNVVPWGVHVILCDHHATAEHLNKYEWAEVHETVDGIPRCGTWQLAKKFPEVITDMNTFITLVDDWDTWKWTKNGNEYANKLNSLLQVLGEEKFTEYLTKDCYEKYRRTKPEHIFDDWANTILEAHEMFVNKTAGSCERNMWRTTISLRGHEFLTGIVFCNNDISEVAHIILSNNPELDILMLVGLPNSISFRTQKQLSIPLGEIAKALTGSGGGHPQSAGATLSGKQFSDGFIGLLRRVSKEINFSYLKSPVEKE